MSLAQTVLKVRGLFSFGSENWNSFEGHSDFFPRQKEKEEVLYVTAAHAKGLGQRECQDRRTGKAHWGFGMEIRWCPGGR